MSDAERRGGLAVNAAGEIVLDDSFVAPWSPEALARRAAHEPELRAKYGDEAFERAEAVTREIAEIIEGLEAP